MNRYLVDLVTVAAPGHRNRLVRHYGAVEARSKHEAAMLVKQQDTCLNQTLAGGNFRLEITNTAKYATMGIQTE